MLFYTKYKRSAIVVRLLPAFLCLVVHITDSNAGIVTSPGLQRKLSLRTCTLQWTVNEPIVNCSLYNQTTGSQTPLSSNGIYTSVNSVITLTIVNVQLWDAGNYSVVVTTDRATYTDANACLFVYGNLQGSVAITFRSNSPTEGEAVELMCNLTSNSLPVAYRPSIYYTWSNLRYGQFKNISNGTAMLQSGELLPGYTVKNNGRTLRISSIKHPDDESGYCYGSEDVLNNGWSSFYAYMPYRYRPYIASLNPPNKKFNAIVSCMVSLSFYAEANPPINSKTNWTFVNSAGISQDLPPDSVVDGSYSTNIRRLRFNFTSTAFYGTYSITLTNYIGSKTTTFQVLPESLPDAPSNLVLYCVSHYSVLLQWNQMASNVMTRYQTVITDLRQFDNDNEIETIQDTYYDDFNFNSTRYSLFLTNIQPLTYYKVRVWSTNRLGSSGVVELKFRTRSQPTLTVLPEMIRINGTQMIINFDVELGENTESIVYVKAQCCSRWFLECVNNETEYTGNQIVLSNIPNVTEYYVDVAIYSGIYSKYNYYSDRVKGVKVSRNGNSGNSNSNICEVNRSLLVGVIVLATLLGTSCGRCDHDSVLQPCGKIKKRTPTIQQAPNDSFRSRIGTGHGMHCLE